MPESSPGRKKRKLTIVACEQGVERAEKALVRLGFESRSNFAESQRLSRSVVSKFFQKQPIQLDSFKRICEVLKLKWQDIAGLTEEKIESELIKRQVNPKPDIKERVKPVNTLVRQVTVVDKPSQTIKAVIKLQGDINSPPNLQILAAVLKEYAGNTIEIIDIKKGSIKLIIEGCQEDVERLLSLIQSGKITELEGFTVENSESAEDTESNEKKWHLVEEIVTTPIEGRDLSGADLSDADLRNACLINANLSNSDLSDSDLFGANLFGANLFGANLSSTNLSGADLSGADLSGADLSGADLIGADLSDANLKGADLRGADLFGANLSGADLIGGNLCGAYLIGADLFGANLSGADLIGAYLSEANVEDARFGNNLGISETIKQDLIQRGAIFEDSPDARSPVPVR